MKHFHQNYVYRPTETEKKGRRVKTPHKESCKCYAPLVKLHYYECPALRKSCPLHGRPPNQETPDGKEELPEQNMVISFHPSSKTERLLHPVKTLLAQCDPDTKINLQYYSPNSTASTESLRHRQVQTQSDEGRRPDSPVFVEKTKSFVSDKTNKMKKLKQCFHSPCNSIAQKSRSQTSVKEKLNEIFHEDKKKTSDFVKLAPDKPPDDIKCDPAWFSSRFDFRNWEKLSGGRNADSDFITITRQAKNNLINHKIFEIKHKKGLSDLPFARLPKPPTQLVYSTVKVDGDFGNREGQKRLTVAGSPGAGENPVRIKEKQKGDEELRSESQQSSSSSSSVYFTPFVFVPAVSESKNKPQPLAWTEEGVHAEGPDQGQKGRLSQGTQTPSLQSEQEITSQSREPKTKSVLLQTDLDRQSGDSATQGWYLAVVDVAQSFTTRGTQTDEGLHPSDKNLGDQNSAESTLSEITYCPCKDKNSSSRTRSEATRSVKTVEVQTSVHHKSESSLESGVQSVIRLDKNIQTEVSIRGSRKSSVCCKCCLQGSGQKVASRGTQTNSEESREEVSEFIGLDSSNVTYVIKPFGQQESDQAIDKLAKAWWGKSHSDSEVQNTEQGPSAPKPETVCPLTRDCDCRSSAETRDAGGSSKHSRKSEANYVAEKTPRTPKKVDKAMGTDDGGTRLYRRAEKGLGTESLISVPFKKSTKFVTTTTESSKTTTSSKTPERSTKPERTPAKADSPRTPLSDLSELTKIIQEFFEKTGMASRANCTCDVLTVSQKKSESEKATPEGRKPKASDKKVDSEGVRDQGSGGRKKSKGELADAETQATAAPKGGTPTDGRQPNKQFSDRVKIRRSVLLEEAEPKIRFVCSVCAREISTYSINAATNTDSFLTCRKNEKPEVSELVKVKNVRTVYSLDFPERSSTSAPVGKVGRSTDATPKESELPQTSARTRINPLNVNSNDKVSRDRQSPRSVRQDTASVKSPATPAVKMCACDPCIIGTSNFRAPPSKPDDPHMPSASSKADKSSQEGKVKRSPEHYYPVLIRSHWPKNLTWSLCDNARSNVPEKSSSQQKRSYEKDADPGEAPAGKKIKAEAEKPPRQCFILEDAASSNLHVGDPTVIPSKGNLVWFPSYSASHVSPLGKNNSFQWKSIKSEEKLRGEDHRQCSVSTEGCNVDGSSDLYSVKSCHLAPIPLGCGSEQQMIECRVCKSLTLLKNDKDEVFFHLPQGLLAYYPGPSEGKGTTARRVHGEESFERLRQNDSSTQNFEKLLEECSRFSESDSPSMGEPEEKADERETEEPKGGPQTREASDLIYSVSSNSFKKFLFETYSKK